MVVSPNSDSQVENLLFDTTSSIKEKSSEENQTEEGYLLRSPMVGTFYRAASPESEEFVKARYSKEWPNSMYRRSDENNE